MKRALSLVLAFVLLLGMMPMQSFATEGAHTHSYTSTVTAPTCTEQGYTTYACDCGDSYVDCYVDATGHRFEDGLCKECAEVESDNLIDISKPTSAKESSWSYADGIWTMTNSNYVNLRYDVELEEFSLVKFSFMADVISGSLMATIRTADNEFLVTKSVTTDGMVTLEYSVVEGGVYRFQVCGVNETSCAEISKISVIIDSDELADEYIEEGERVIDEVKSIGADLAILLFADNHNYECDKYLKYADLMRHKILDYQVGLGDYVDYSHSPKNIASKSLQNCIACAGNVENCLYAYGNHDVGICGVNAGTDSLDVVMTPEENYEILVKHLTSNANVVFDEVNPHGGYYYVDDEESKIRIIILNTSDIFDDTSDEIAYVRYQQQLRVSQTQLSWFANKALNFTEKAVPSEWTVVVFGHAYNPYGDNMLLFDILNAVQNGTSIDESITVYKRLTLQEDGTYSNEVDTVNGDSYAVCADYSDQGPINVIGYIHGHDHVDNHSVISGINRIQLRCDNGNIDQYYIAPCSSTLQGTYYFRDVSGNIYTFTCNSEVTGVSSIGYNFYWTGAKSESAPISVFDENGIRIRSVACKYAETPPEGATEITGFVSERDGSLVGKESCAVLCIDKDSRTLTFIPYGTGTKRVITYTGHTHTYSFSVTAPTCTEQGYTTYTCACGDSYIDEYVDALGHTYANGLCIGCGTHHPGDVNGDGAVNNKDVTRLFQYLSDYDVEVVEAALDVNGDGSVNNKDVSRLFQYLSGWDVEIF